MDETLTCPLCGRQALVLRYEVAYVYSYVLDGNAPGLANDAVFHPYAYDERRQKAAEQYVECTACHGRFPCFLQKAAFDLEQLREILGAYREKEGAATDRIN